MKDFCQKLMNENDITPPKPLDKNVETFYQILPYAIVGGLILAVVAVIIKKVK
jgi:hypothetical protein